MKNIFLVPIFILCLLICFSIYGCSGKPTENNGKTVVENMLKQSYGTKRDNIIILSFKKTNGEDKIIDGSNAYIIEFDMEVKSEKNGYLSFQYLQFAGNTFAFYDIEETDPSGIAQSVAVHKMLSNGVALLNGEPAVFRGKIIFIKTEKGWKGMDGNIY